MLMVGGAVVHGWWGKLTAVGWFMFASATFSLLLLLQGLAATMTIETKDAEGELARGATVGFKASKSPAYPTLQF